MSQTYITSKSPFLSWSVIVFSSWFV